MILKSAAGVCAAMTIAVSPCMAADADTTAVQNAMQRLSAAMIAADAPTMTALTSDALSYGHSSGRVQDQKDFVDAIATGKPYYRRINLTNMHITVKGDTAVMRNHFDGTIETAGKQSEVALETLLVWTRQSGDWKLVARQGYKP